MTKNAPHRLLVASTGPPSRLSADPHRVLSHARGKPRVAGSDGGTAGSYSVTAKTGEGGMGEVYRARDTKLDRDVALKVAASLYR